MAYQVIARKWRPKEFNEIIGQDHISQTLVNALKNNRLPHALLFTGPRGTGKTSSARVLAKALRCPKAVDFVPCNECNDCLEISAGNNVNVSEIDGASNNGVEAIRELRESVGYMPSTGKYKIYIIDEVHMLSTSAFNALLKTLEEPPEHVIFVLATTEVQKIPNTILSRCQRFDFRRIPVQKVTDHLAKICEEEGVAADKDALWIIARQGDGSMRDSQSLLDQVITFCEGSLTRESVTDVLGLTDRELLIETLRVLSLRQHDQMLGVLQKIFEAGYDPKVFSQDLLESVRNLLLVKISESEKAPQIVDLPDGEIQALKEIAAELSQENIHLLFDMALKGGNDIPRSQSPQIVLEMLLLRMVHAPNLQSIAQFVQSQPVPAAPAPQRTPREPDPTPVKKALSPKAEPPSPPPPSAPMESKPTASLKNFADDLPPAEPQQGKDRWSALVQRIKKVNPIVASQLENTFLMNLDSQLVTIGVPAKLGFIYDKLNDSQFQKKVINYLNTFWGPGYSLKIEKSKDVEEKANTPKAIENKKHIEKKNEIQKKVEAHPMIKKTHDLFKTEITAIKKLKLTEERS